MDEFLPNETMVETMLIYGGIIRFVNGGARLADFVSYLLWMDKKSISHHLETMVEAIRFVGIYVGQSNPSRVS